MNVNVSYQRVDISIWDKLLASKWNIPLKMLNLWCHLLEDMCEKLNRCPPTMTLSLFQPPTPKSLDSGHAMSVFVYFVIRLRIYPSWIVIGSSLPWGCSVWRSSAVCLPDSIPTWLRSSMSYKSRTEDRHKISEGHRCQLRGVTQMHRRK